MQSSVRTKMRGLAECPQCQEQLEAPLAAAGRTARCPACHARFMLPSAETLFTNAAAYLALHEVQRTDNDDYWANELRFTA